MARIAMPNIRPVKSDLQSPQIEGRQLSKCIEPLLASAQQSCALRKGLSTNSFGSEQRESFRKGMDIGKDAAGTINELTSQASEHASTIIAKAGAGDRALKALPKHLIAVEQLNRDAARIKAELILAGRASRNGSAAAESAKTFLQPIAKEVEALIATENNFVQQYRNLINSYGRVAQSNIGQFSLAAEKVLLSSRIGKKIVETGKIVSDPLIGKFLMFVGGATTAWKVYEKSLSRTRVGKSVHAGLSGGMSAGFEFAATKMTPWIVVADTAIKYGGEKVGLKDAEQWTIGAWAEGTANVYMAIGRALWTGDSEPVSQLHAQSMRGENGKILQGYAMLGEQLSRVMDPVISKLVDWTTDAPATFKASQSWWQTQPKF